MGADGGVLITKIKDIKENWSTIKERLIEDLESMYSSTSIYHSTEDIDQLVAIAKQLPENIATLEGKAIKELLMFLKARDCPYLLDGNYLVTGIGDYVEDQMQSLSYALEDFGMDIETWT